MFTLDQVLSEFTFTPMDRLPLMNGSMPTNIEPPSSLLE